MNALGRHILAEIYGCDAAILNNRNLIEKIMVESLSKLVLKLEKWHSTNSVPGSKRCGGYF